MFRWLKNVLRRDIRSSYQAPAADPRLSERLSGVLLDDLVRLRELCSNTSDLLVRQITISGIPVAFVMCEGMFNLQTLTEIVIEPLTALQLKEPTPQKLMVWMDQKTLLAGDQKEFLTFGEAKRGGIKSYANNIYETIA